MSCPFQNAIKREVDSIKKQSRCNDEFNGTELCNKDCKNGPTETHCDKNTLSHTNGNISGRDISPSPKHRKESGLSLCSQASSDELDGADEIKLGLVGLIESVGTLLLPSVNTYIDTMLIISLVYILYISSRILTSPFIIQDTNVVSSNLDQGEVYNIMG
jgi:hypothetical protein